MRPRQPAQTPESVSLERSHVVHQKFGPARMEMQIWKFPVSEYARLINHCSTRDCSTRALGPYSDRSSKKIYQLATFSSTILQTGNKEVPPAAFGGEVLTNLNHLLYLRSLDQLCLSLRSE